MFFFPYSPFISIFSWRPMFPTNAQTPSRTPWPLVTSLTSAWPRRCLKIWRAVNTITQLCRRRRWSRASRRNLTVDEEHSLSLAWCVDLGCLIKGRLELVFDPRCLGSCRHDWREKQSSAFEVFTNSLGMYCDLAVRLYREKSTFGIARDDTQVLAKRDKLNSLRRKSLQRISNYFIPAQDNWTF